MYKAIITRDNPSAIIVMLDISGSMEDIVFFDGQKITKRDAVAQTINDLISELIARCKREEGYRDYIDIAIIGYGSDKVLSLLPEGADDEFFRKPSELAKTKTPHTTIYKDRILPDGVRTITPIEKRIWIKPEAHGRTPMHKCFTQVYEILKKWLINHSDKYCFSPVVINITDGEATDADEVDLKNISAKIKDLSTADGNVLLINMCLTPDSSQNSIFLPRSKEELPDKPFAKLMYEISSIMPSLFVNEQTGSPLNRDNCKGLCYNASMEDLINMLNIGTISVKLIK